MSTVLVTGAEGFIGRNVALRLREASHEVIPVVRATQPQELRRAVEKADAVIHLAGVNRPKNEADFMAGNRDVTASLCEALQDANNAARIIYGSSIQAGAENPYGRSKLAAEECLELHAKVTGAKICLFRLPNVFGKWARPNYNSAVATFCHNAAHGLPLEVRDPDAPLKLAYIDDVAEHFLRIIENIDQPASGLMNVDPIYRTTVGEVAGLIVSFASGRRSLRAPSSGAGLERALYATFLSYLPTRDFHYPLPIHSDPRGMFVEMLKTSDSGQFSYFTSAPGVTRGGHYHHSKVEKFLVVSGQARFRFRHLLNDEVTEIVTKATDAVVVETIPGWTHEVTNLGKVELICLLWASEIFDRDRPDTVAQPV